MAKVLENKVAIVTGSGRGLGRSEAIELGKQGAKVVVADIEAAKKYADEVVEEIIGFGGEAVASYGDVGNWHDCERTIKTAIETFGDLNIVVNNAGFLRDRMLFKMSEEEFDSVIRVHLKGHFNYSRLATAYWRDKSKEQGGPVYARIINTASESFLYSAPGQPNYAAAKAGIVSLTINTALTMAKMGVTANAILPRAKTDMTAGLEGFDELGPEKIAPVVAYLASPEAAKISGYIFGVWGGTIQMVNPPTFGDRFTTDKIWSMDSLNETLTPYFNKRKPIVDGYFVQPIQM